MATPSGTVKQNTLNGGSLIFTDTGSYTNVTSRILTIYDYLGNVVSPSPFNMGTSTIQIFDFSSDAWFHFQCITTDQSGANTIDVYFVADGFYWDSYTEIYNSTNCGCGVNDCNLEKSQNALNAALRFNLAGLSGAASAQREIVAANVLVNMSAIIQLG